MPEAIMEEVMEEGAEEMPAEEFNEQEHADIMSEGLQGIQEALDAGDNATASELIGELIAENERYVEYVGGMGEEAPVEEGFEEAISKAIPG